MIHTEFTSDIFLIIKQMEEMWHVNWKVTFVSKYPSFAKNQQGKEWCACSSM